MYTTLASTLGINKPPLWNKQLTANTDKKYMRQIKITYARSALPMRNTRNTVLNKQLCGIQNCVIKQNNHIHIYRCDIFYSVHMYITLNLKCNKMVEHTYDINLFSELRMYAQLYDKIWLLLRAYTYRV